MWVVMMTFMMFDMRTLQATCEPYRRPAAVVASGVTLSVTSDGDVTAGVASMKDLGSVMRS